eukprot:365296-Chlamydomonas_euryale.AAC.33
MSTGCHANRCNTYVGGHGLPFPPISHLAGLLSLIIGLVGCFPLSSPAERKVLPPVLAQLLGERVSAFLGWPLPFPPQSQLRRGGLDPGRLELDKVFACKETARAGGGLDGEAAAVSSVLTVGRAGPRLAVSRCSSAALVPSPAVMPPGRHSCCSDSDIAQVATVAAWGCCCWYLRRSCARACSLRRGGYQGWGRRSPTASRQCSATDSRAADASTPACFRACSKRAPYLHACLSIDRRLRQRFGSSVGAAAAEDARADGRQHEMTLASRKATDELALALPGSGKGDSVQDTRYARAASEPRQTEVLKLHSKARKTAHTFSHSLPHTQQFEGLRSSRWVPVAVHF